MKLRKEYHAEIKVGIIWHEMRTHSFREADAWLARQRDKAIKDGLTIGYLKITALNVRDWREFIPKREEDRN